MSVYLPFFRSSFFTVPPLLMLWAGSSCRWDSTHVLHPLLEAARHPEGWVACFPAFTGDHCHSPQSIAHRKLAYSTRVFFSDPTLI
jgi:hypothetical protein